VQVDEFWRSLELAAPPQGSTDGPTRRSEVLRASLAEGLARPSAVWDKAARYREALQLAELLRAAASDLRRVAGLADPRQDPDGEEHRSLTAILTHLLGPAEAAHDANGILRAMLELDVVQTAITGATDEPEQTVELVQVSAHANAAMGPAVEQKLTGVQLHHFGAFYRKSWRVNDWLWGRLDAATRLTETLLVPERLRQLGHTPEQALDLVRRLATTGEQPEDHAYLVAEFDEAQCARELRACLDPADPRGQLPAGLSTCAAQLARARHLSILREELPRLATAIITDADQSSPLSVRNRAWLARYHEVRVAGPLTAADAFALLQANDIGSQRIADDLGSDGLTELTASAAAVAAGALSSTTRFRPVRLGLKALRGYALLLWAMVLLTRNRGRIGVAVVQAAVISGAALLALSLLVPGIPAAISLLGVSVILATITLACLRSLSVPRSGPGSPGDSPGELERYRRKAVRRIGLRMAVPSVLLLGVVFTLAARWGQLQVQTDTITKALVTLAVILVGSWLGRVSLSPLGKPAEPVGFAETAAARQSNPNDPDDPDDQQGRPRARRVTIPRQRRPEPSKSPEQSVSKTSR
jgi:hypothetical protein